MRAQDVARAARLHDPRAWRDCALAADRRALERHGMTVCEAMAHAMHSLTVHYVTGDTAYARRLAIEIVRRAGLTPAFRAAGDVLYIGRGRILLMIEPGAYSARCDVVIDARHDEERGGRFAHVNTEGRDGPKRSGRRGKRSWPGGGES